MSTPYIGEIRIVGFTFPPPGWMQCLGQLVSINDFPALYQLLGTTYGGDGQTTFGLPNLQGRVPVHQGSLAGGSTYTMGQMGGATAVTVSTPQMPGHGHSVSCQSAAGTQSSAAGNYFAGSATVVYTTDQNPINMGSVVGPAGGSQPHANMQPYLAMTYIIATEGIYPSQN